MIVLALLPLYSISIDKKSIVSPKSDEYQIEIDQSSNYADPFHQNEFGDPPTVWIVMVAIISTGGFCIIVYSIYMCIKQIKQRKIANCSLINQNEDQYNAAIPPTIPQQTYQQPLLEYQQQNSPYDQQPFQDLNYQQPSQTVNVY